MIGIGIGVPFSFSSPIDANAQTIYNRIIADGGVSNLTRLNFFVKGLKAIYGDLANVPVCYDAHWIGYKLGSGTGATAGQAAAKLYSLTVAGDAVQATAASQPLLLAHNGASSDNYWYGSNVAGNNCSTPNASANRITGDLEVVVRLKVGSFSSAYSTILSTFSAGKGFNILIGSGYTLLSEFGLTGGNTSVTSSVAISTSFDGYIKMSREVSSGQVRYYTKVLLTDNWVQLGTTLSTPTTNIVASTEPLKIGSYTGTPFEFSGRNFNTTIANSISTTPLTSNSTSIVVDFNPATYNASTSQTAWTSSTGEIWTISTGTADTGYKGVLVNRTIVQGDGIDDAIETANSVWGAVSSVYSAITFINLDIKKGTVIDSNLANNVVQKFEGPDSVNTYWLYQGGIGFNRSIAGRKNLNTLYNSIRNGVSSAISFNNGTDTTGTLNTAITTGVRVFSSRNGATYTNGNLNTLLISGLADNSTTRTATYNLIRSLNNNAF